jgi:hypothetical protein
MLTPEAYLRAYNALSQVKAKWAGGNYENHKISRATKFEVKAMLSDPSINHDRLLSDSFAWLTEHLESLEVYERILGRPYNPDERSRLTKEVELVASQPCPIHGAIMCSVPDELRPQVAQDINHVLSFLPFSYLRWGFLPAMIAAELAPKDLEAMIRDGRIADAKVSTVSLAGMVEHELVVA